MRLHPQRPSDEHAHEHVVTFDIETIVDEEPADGGFPPWPRHQPVAACFLSASWTPDGYSFALETSINLLGEEAQFYKRVDQLLPRGPTGVSYNGLGFDLSVLQISAMAAGCFELPGLSNQTHAQRYGREHCDLSDQFSHYGATRRCSLSELCGRLHIPVKTSVHGSDVGALWRAGEVEAVARYVEEDVVATYLLWLHWDAFRASDEKRIVAPLDGLSRWIERRPDLAHLNVFATCPPARWARSRAPAYRVADALANAARRVERQETERAFGREPATFGSSGRSDHLILTLRARPTSPPPPRGGGIGNAHPESTHICSAPSRLPPPSWIRRRPPTARLRSAT